LLQNYRIREYNNDDSEDVLHFISDMIVNEFNITLDFDKLDSDLIHLKQHYKDNGGCFWIVERIDNYQIIGTVAIRNLAQLVSTTTTTTDDDDVANAPAAELKRMFLLKPYRGLGIGQQMLDTALNFAKKSGYSKILLYSSKTLTASRSLYLKNGFVDIPRYNDDHRADIFMGKKL
jgi:GNAT superfamily N-acetyltransferase